MSYPSNIDFIGSKTSFENSVKSSYQNIIKNKSIADIRNINNMFGFESGITSDQVNFDINRKLAYSSLIQFYNFWGRNDSVSLSKKYVIESLIQNDIENTTSMISYNYVATYILFIFFGNSMINISDGTISSHRPDINNQKNSQNFTGVIINIKNFISQSSGQLTSLLGAGNYNLQSTGGQNRGFVYYMCINDIYQSLTVKKKFLLESDQNLTNDPSIYSKLTSKQISFYRKEMSKNPILANWCGCFAPIPTFLQGQSFSSNFNTQSESPCDPLCYNEDNIGLYEVTDTGPVNQTPRIPCNGEICVIDNVSIESFAETGRINFNQVCKGCKAQNKNCLCFLDVSTPNLVNKISSGQNAMVNQVNYVQNCPNSICFKVDDTTGSESITECNRFNIPSSATLDGALFRDGLSSNKYPQKISNNLFFIFIVALFLFIIYQPKIFFNL